MIKHNVVGVKCLIFLSSAARLTKGFFRYTVSFLAHSSRYGMINLTAAK